MGKIRRNKVRHSDYLNPLIFNSNGIAELQFDGDDEFSHDGPIGAIREQLQNSNIEEKINGLQTLAVFASNKEKVDLLCTTDIIRIVGPLLCERDEAVRNAAAGALRNCSVHGTEICEYLVLQDLMTPLLALLMDYMHDDDWTPKFDASMRDEIDLRSDIFLQAINLLWNLCESSMEALKIFNQANIYNRLLQCLNYKKYGLDISISVAQCLLVVSENNSTCWNVLSNCIPELIALLEISGKHGYVYLSTLTAGILANIPALAASYVMHIVKTLSHSLDVDHQSILLNTISSLQQQETDSSAPELEIRMDTNDTETEDAARIRRRRQELPTDADIAVRDVGFMLDAQRIAAEILTNLTSNDEEDWQECEDTENSEEESVTDFNADMEKDSSDCCNKLPVELSESIKSLAVVEKLWKKAQPLQEDVVDLLRCTNDDLLKKTNFLRVSSLIALQNMCNCLDTEDLGGCNAVYNVWVELGKQVFKVSPDTQSDISLLEPSTSLMRSALEHLKSSKDLFSQMSQNDLELILGGINNCSVPEIRANWFRMLGTLGCLLPETLVKIIILFIIEATEQEEDVWCMSEALDAFMDIFADNDWHQIVIEGKIIERIQNLSKVFKAKGRQQKKDLMERYFAVQTVQLNLTRFIKYMEAETSKYMAAKNVKKS
ncbi:HEAT repeat-containing protein 3 [Teleopsis dalmanni]|uniref:HEAT repeat-containing protein 3 n=1 Tax=Teleopsis dalmanni TaxID=139649 RepID=UPI0018CD2E5A|nr:HEAT repeat-containing protein 3 [Teleopsis dalmanni]